MDSMWHSIYCVSTQHMVMLRQISQEHVIYTLSLSILNINKRESHQDTAPVPPSTILLRFRSIHRENLLVGIFPVNFPNLMLVEPLLQQFLKISQLVRDAWFDLTKVDALTRRCWELRPLRASRFLIGCVAPVNRIRNVASYLEEFRNGMIWRYQSYQ